MKVINNELIRSFSPCYDPSEKGIPDNENLPVKEWVDKYRNIVPAEDILWLLLRNEFYDDRQLRLFAVWCAREALKVIDNPDPRSINACNVAERFANGEATKEELGAAGDAAWAVTLIAVGTVAVAAWIAVGVVSAAAWAAARRAAWNTMGEKQLDYLLTFE